MQHLSVSILMGHYEGTFEKTFEARHIKDASSREMVMPSLDLLEQLERMINRRGRYDKLLHSHTETRAWGKLFLIDRNGHRPTT